MPFKRDFESLYNISMSMADEVIGVITNENLPDRLDKLNEEYNELLIEFDIAKTVKLLNDHMPTHLSQKDAEIKNRLKGELGDVLFVLLHIAHGLQLSPHALLHGASMKMLTRMNDINYKPKN